MKIVKGVLLTAALAIAVSAETLTLQQGENGYTGCTDTYIESEDGHGHSGVTTNYGNDENLAAGYLRYQWN